LDDVARRESRGGRGGFYRLNGGCIGNCRGGNEIHHINHRFLRENQTRQRNVIESISKGASGSPALTVDKYLQRKREGKRQSGEKGTGAKTGWLPDKQQEEEKLRRAGS